ncbi:helix-turn-helix domain-containing protein [Streptomyces litchfieldiae]|uniref:Helix-turn-helix transcriptional regulator n=1 Tax=Streptomyces litchfieldiae TaxID=3075543 RepID=A0ABU2MNT2_9ACTN|nr:helix-turn-helix transcriptional regulator [Streptomyces sp. DSM 44938]MDT0343282.1 helix-turn-helix transcriptional regulator [Streptomyces sp. DSM 44938]
MVNKKPLDPKESPAAFCGAQMRAKREEAGLTLDVLGMRVFTGPSYLAQLERAERKLQPDLGRLLDKEFNTGTFFHDLAWAIKRASRHAEYFAQVAELEKVAESILEYSSVVVPGMMQTEGYARAVIEAANPFGPADRVNELVSARMERAHRFRETGRPWYWAVLPEAVIRSQFGGPAVMREQLLHLATAMQEQRAMIQIFPLASPVPSPLTETLRIMDFPDAPPIVYFETSYAGTLIDDPTIIAKQRRAYDWQRAAALSPDASLDLIESVAKDLNEP